MVLANGLTCNSSRSPTTSNHTSVTLPTSQSWWSKYKNLPPSVRIFTMDAVTMYSNIDPRHCVDTLRAYLTNSPVARDLDL
jgi:hypothetical protein